MERENTSIDILKNIAKHEGWDIDVKSRTHSTRHGHHVREVHIKNYEYKDCLFISNQTTRSDKYRSYSGVFVPITFKHDYKLLIRKRDVLDKLSFRKDRLRFKTGASDFDSKIYIETNNDIETHKLLSSSGIQLKIIEFLESTEQLEIGVGNSNLYIDDNSAKNYLSVIIYMGWMLDKELINSAFKLADILKMKFN
ncbi:MAG TPA: hypothetical protein DCG75_07600 [Bacteroidales bacterium]|nr:hypothetical protein [Bacteroidales bacterium]